MNSYYCPQSIQIFSANLCCELTGGGGGRGGESNTDVAVSRRRRSEDNLSEKFEIYLNGIL